MNSIILKINKLFKSLLSRRAKLGPDENPWAGLSPYEDPLKTDNPLKFYGREDETVDVFKLIDENIVATLYGKSGIGKTSLLNAGVFPMLRENDYAPFSIRFTTNSNGNETFGEQIIQLLNKSFDGKNGHGSLETISVVPENHNPESEDYLWSFFARSRFLNTEGKNIFPVLVFDQFEESIRINRNQSSLLLKQIAYLANRQNMLKDTYVENEYYTYNYNFRFVISIREDDLFRLEDLLNINYLSTLRNGRYRLQNLSKESARLIVEKVGKEFILQEDMENVSERIIAVSKAKEDSLIQTNVISLVCSRLYNLVLNEGKKKITLEDTERYLSKDPFEEYYTAAIKNLSEGEKRFIETSFVSADGRRNLLPESILQRCIKSHCSLIEGETSIFHRLQSPLGESLVELIHDGLCSTVIRHREIRLEKKNKTIMALCLIILGLIGLWMLNVSIVDNFVACFLTLFSKGLFGLRYNDVLTLVELISILLFPIAIGSIVYGYEKKKMVGIIGYMLYIFPSMLYPSSFIKIIASSFFYIQKNYENIDTSDIFFGFSDNTHVFIVFSIVAILLYSINFFGRPGIKRKESYFKVLWSSLSVRIYLLALSIFLYYKSIFNTGSFIIESHDSSWGLLVIPLIALSVFGISLRSKGKKVVFWIFTVFQGGLVICSICEVYLSVSFLLSYLLITFLMLIILFKEKNTFETILKSVGSIIIISIVIFLNLGYNPIFVNIPGIYKIYPWKIVVVENDSQFGIYDAIYGDTLLIPEFKRDSTYNLYYCRILPQNLYINSIKANSVGDSSIPFPLKLTKLDTGQWMLTLRFSPNYEYAINKLAHPKVNDSTILTNKGGANLFIRLRNDISSFCISGDDAVLLSDISYLNQYEEIIKQDLSHSLHQLAINDSIMTESQIVRFIKALSRSVYMNMLKEAILKKHYNDFISWYSDYYIAVVLTSITSETGIKWSNDINYNWNLSLKSGEDTTYNYNQSNSFSVTLDGLNNNRVYAWYNLFYALCLLECNVYAPIYYSDMNKKIQDDKIVMGRLLEKTNELYNRLSSHQGILQKQSESLHNVLNNITDKNSRGENLNTEDITQILKVIIDANSSSNKVKKNVSSEMNSYSDNVITLTDSLETIVLLQANKQFENIITGTFDSLDQIIKSSPTNAYNGLLISLCQELYVIGLMRGYDMKGYADKLTVLDQAGTLPLYNFVKRTESINQRRSQLLDSIRNQIGVNNILVKQILDQITK